MDRVIVNEEFTDNRRRMVPGSEDSRGGPTPTPKGGRRKTSPRDMRQPTDLMRSRRVGLRRTTCLDCGAVKDQGVCRHAAWCPAETYKAWNREARTQRGGPKDGKPFTEWACETTGPMLPKETSAETGWKDC